MVKIRLCLARSRAGCHRTGRITQPRQRGRESLLLLSLNLPDQSTWISSQAKLEQATEGI